MSINAFGEEISRLRKLRGLSTTQLGARLAVSSTSVMHIESGKRLPRVAIVRALAGALNVPLDHLAARLEETHTARDQARRQAVQASAVEPDKPADPRLWLAWHQHCGRLRQGVSLSALDRLCGFGKGYSRSVERGEVLPHDQALARLGEVLRVPLSVLQDARDQARAAKAARRVRRAMGASHAP